MALKISKIIPKGYRVLVELPSAEEKTKSGIIIVSETREKEQRNSIVGKVIAMGESADPVCDVGDWVLIAKYGGFMLKSTGLVDEERDLRILNDEDILATVEVEEKS